MSHPTPYIESDILESSPYVEKDSAEIVAKFDTATGSLPDGFSETVLKNEAAILQAAGPSVVPMFPEYS